MVFFMGGPQLGELEAGLVANWFGPVLSVVTGGIGCVATTTWVAARTPALVEYRRAAPVGGHAAGSTLEQRSVLQDVQAPSNPSPED
jgi:hypothetical protein